MTYKWFLWISFTALCVTGFLHLPAYPADERTVGVFVALCDNEHQGIVPVPKAIGNGEDPERNLYWGSAEGFMGIWGKSPRWKKETADPLSSSDILRTYTCRHVSGNVLLKAFAYRGSAIQTCLQDFEQALGKGTYDLAVYIGHNGLMDFSLPLPVIEASRPLLPESIVLCCKSQAYFGQRMEALQANPLLLTTQFMYPGSFLLRDVLEEWIKGAGRTAYRNAAGQAYAANQKITVKAALGVFANLEKGTAGQ